MYEVGFGPVKRKAREFRDNATAGQSNANHATCHVVILTSFYPDSVPEHLNKMLTHKGRSEIYGQSLTLTVSKTPPSSSVSDILSKYTYCDN